MVNDIDDSQAIIIVGAGVAGLSAAEELQSSGQSYIVLEGRGRIGGRIFTHELPQTQPTNFELGAAWFHNCPHNRLAHALESVGFKSIYDDSQTVIYDSEGELDQNLVNTMSFRFNEFRNKSDPSVSLDQIAANFANLLISGEEKRVLMAVVSGYQLSTGLKSSQIGSQVKCSSGRDKAVQGGYINIVRDFLAKNLDQNKIKLGAKVTHITSFEEAGHVEVTTQNGEKFKGKAVIVTVPVGVLKKGVIDFKPTLGSHIVQSVENTAIAYVEKVYITFSSRFWSPDVCKFVISDKNNPALIWNWELAHPGTHERNTLAVLVTNETAFELHRQSKNAFEVVKPLLKIIAKTEISEPTQIIISSWITDEFSEGSFSAVPRGITREELAQPFIDGAHKQRVLFAGEHAIIEDAGLVQGAWLSGKQAAKRSMELQTL